MWIYTMLFGYYLFILATIYALWREDWDRFVGRFSRPTQAKIWLTLPVSFQLWVAASIALWFVRAAVACLRTIVCLLYRGCERIDLTIGLACGMMSSGGRE